MDDSTQPSIKIEMREYSPSSAEPDPVTNQRRGSDCLPSLNELAAHQKVTERKEAVHDWLVDSSLDLSSPSCENSASDILALSQPRDDFHDEVPFGIRTENRHLSEQIYFNDSQVAEQDYNIISSNRNWGNAPMLYSIANTRLCQPESSQAAIEKFERLVRDTDSIISRAPTWGTRRCSVSSTESEEETIVGNILRKFRRRDNTTNRAGNLFRDIRGRLSRPVASHPLKRNRTTKEEETAESADLQGKRIFQPSTFRMSSWAKKPMPSINTALMSMAPSLPSIAKTGLADYTRLPPPPSIVVTDNLATPILPKSRPGSDTSSPQIEGVQPTSNNNINEAPSLPLSQEYRTKPILEPDISYQTFKKPRDSGFDEPSDDENFYYADCSEALDEFSIDFPTELGRPASIKSEKSAVMGLEGFDDGPPTPLDSRQPCPSTDPVKDKPKGVIPTEDSGLECLETSGAQHHCEVLMPGSIKSKRQVGFARVKIDIISLPNINSPPSGQFDDESGQSSECETETEEGFDEEQADTEDQDRVNLSPQDLPSGSSGGSSSSLTGASTNPNGKNAGGGVGSSGNTRSRTKASRSTSKKRTERFACPYQAFEASQPCFRPGPRNPNGGCAGIQRLKQHLSRRHMMSYRCIRCWRSFETRDRSEAHGKHAGSCEAREMLTTERFMTPNQETDLEKTSCAGSEEETWWEIFRLLIPDMQNRTRESLKSQYWPYYMHLDSFMMPSMIFPNALFESEHTEVHVPGATLEETGYMTQNTQDPCLTMDPLSFPDPAPASHTVYVPLLDASTGPPSQTGLQALQCSSASQSAASTSTPNTTLTRATSTQQLPETATQLASDQTKLQRNHERLKARYSRLEEDVDEFLAANRTARSDLGRADVAINDLLALEDLPRNIEDTLSEVSQILELVRKRLR
ncbi:hypothetical protein CEP54_007625 [Fusarium duplospermum]|uniref:Uncharacterized protein n=1 Tax=Fusarium duplospermum TaxID=1325734 RepID=A0A428Q0A5_9HYPO|nr:hypothetical protein CEP54_007625 [Fusarium duplospermum]